jgi:putative transposase
MTQPRQFIPGTTYFITRRCTQRQFWLKPTELTNRIFLYCLAVAAMKTGVSIHVVCVMSNHYHLEFTDPDGRAAEFYGWLHKYVAKAINASKGRWENLWSSEKTSVIPISSANDVLGKIVYTLANPVQAQLVADSGLWPGVWLFRKSHSMVIKRPEVYFRSDGTMPDEIQLTIERPPQFAHMSQEAYEELVEEQLFRREQKIAAKMAAKGQSFLGIRAVMGQGFTSSPKSKAPRRELNPRVAAKSKWQRIEAIQRNKAFLAEYHEARKRWKDGERDVLFPYGTYGLRIHAGVRCAPG